MKGMDLARRYWEEVGRPAFEQQCPELLERGAAGLVGEGSECFGYDDEISRDHDWGPGFCFWLTEGDMPGYGEKARMIYHSLPGEFMGFRRLRQSAMSAGRVGVMSVEGFYFRFLGRKDPPHTLEEWRQIPETGLFAATNGTIFQDPVGHLSEIRRSLLEYYPEDLRRKKLAARCALAAQTGQYNYRRCLLRGDRVAALQALAQFIDHAQAIVYLLNRRYRPYYKWAHRGMEALPILGRNSARIMDALVDDGNREPLIEMLCGEIIGVLKEQGLTTSDSDFLLPHAEEIHSRIESAALRNLHLMAE